MSYKIEKQENGKFKIRVWAKRDALGKRKSKQIKDISGIANAKKYAQQLEYELEENIVDITFEKLDNLHYEERKTKISPLTLNTTYKNDRKIAREYLGKIKVSKINTHLIQNFIDELQQKGLKKKTVKNYVSYILSVINWGVNYDYIEFNKIKKLNYKNDEEEFEATTLSIDECADILKYLKENYYNLYIPTLISVLTGARRGEALGLQWEDLDFENNLIHYKNNCISYNGETKTVKQLKTKTSKRTIPMSNFLKEELEEHRNKFAIRDNDNHVCSNLFIGQIYPDYLTHKLHSIVKRKFNINLREHDLRHTFNQIGYENEYMLEERSKLLGHSSTKITEEIYTKYKITQRMYDLVNMLGEQIKSKMCAKKCAI